jgi:membrane-associated phospholipid phosphatase
MSSLSDGPTTGDAGPDSSEPLEGGIPRRIEEVLVHSRRSYRGAALEELGNLDEAVYRTVAETPTPTIDNELRTLSNLANHSKLWFAIAGATAVLGGRRGRIAALDGVIAIGITSFVVNQPLKRLLPRSRPARDEIVLETNRHVKLPTSPSFPSGHSASAFAFANAVGGELPWFALPIRGLAAAVGWSRIHTGVHYPGDVIAGALIGGAVGEVVGSARRMVQARRADRKD